MPKAGKKETSYKNVEKMRSRTNETEERLVGRTEMRVKVGKLRVALNRSRMVANGNARSEESA